MSPLWTPNDYLICTSSTRPAGPREGTMIYETDTNLVLIYDGAAWIVVGGIALPAFRAFRATSVQQVGNGAYVKVSLTGESYDKTACFDNVTNFRGLPLTAGYYQVNGHVRFNLDAGAAVDEPFRVAIYKTGTIYAESPTTFTGPAQNQGVHVSDLVPLNGSSDYLELFCFQNADANVDVGFGSEVTYLSAAWVMPL